MKCSTSCKWLGYNYRTDDLGHIINLTEYKCEKYKRLLGDFPDKCLDCLEATKSRKSYKNRKNSKFYD